MNLSKNVKIDQILGYFAAGVTKRTSAILDMKGYEGVLFVAGLGTIIENGTVDVYPEQNTSDTTVGMAEQAGTSAYTVTAAAAALTYSCILVDIYKPPGAVHSVQHHPGGPECRDSRHCGDPLQGEDGAGSNDDPVSAESHNACQPERGITH
ncbi:MAG: hypothetical protein ABIJ57_10185 [Pseudomonadota bacterium]